MMQGNTAKWKLLFQNMQKEICNFKFLLHKASLFN